MSVILAPSAQESYIEVRELLQVSVSSILAQEDPEI